MASPAETIKHASQFLNGLVEFAIPILNLWLSQLQLVKIQPGDPLYRQIRAFQEYYASYEARSKAAELDRKDIKDAIIGVFRSIDPNFSPEQDPEAAQQIELASQVIMGFYPMLYTTYPDALGYINPRSRVVLAISLSDALAAFPTKMDPDQIAQIADRVSVEIMTDPMKTQGHTTYEIGRIAKAALKNGLISSLDPDQFQQQLTSVLSWTAPIKVMSKYQNQPLEPENMVEVVKQIQTQYPTATPDTLRFELWRHAMLVRGGGIYKALQLRAPDYVRDILNFSGATLDELQRKHQILSVKAINSYLGSAAGAVIRAVRTGLVPLNSPAGQVYRDLMEGRPLAVYSPAQLLNILSASGVRPDVAALMAIDVGGNKQFLTPSAVLSIRTTQFMVDWAPRIEMVYRMYPGNTPSDAAARESMLSMMARQAGYRNVYELAALHSPLVTNELFKTWHYAGELGQRGYEVMGSERMISSVPNIVGRITETLMDIGTGKKQFTLETILPILGFLPNQFPHTFKGLETPPAPPPTLQPQEPTLAPELPAAESIIRESATTPPPMPSPTATLPPVSAVPPPPKVLTTKVN